MEHKKRQLNEFTDEFKNDAIELVTDQGYSCNEVARRLGINHSNVSRWVRDYRKTEEYTQKTLQAISKKPFGPIPLLETKFKSSEYLSMPLEDPESPIGAV